MVVDIVMGNTIEMSWTIVPQDVNDREVFEMGSRNVEEGFSKGEGRMNNNVDGDKGQRGVDFSPLEVVFRANLNRGGRSKAERNNGAINGTVAKLPFSSIGLKGP